MLIKPEKASWELCKQDCHLWSPKWTCTDSAVSPPKPKYRTLRAWYLLPAAPRKVAPCSPVCRALSAYIYSEAGLQSCHRSQLNRQRLPSASRLTTLLILLFYANMVILGSSDVQQSGRYLTGARVGYILKSHTIYKISRKVMLSSTFVFGLF